MVVRASGPQAFRWSGLQMFDVLLCSRFSILRLKLTSAGTFTRGVEGIAAKIRLINTLYNMGVEDIADIDWEEVVRLVGKVTPVCVQRSFYRLKVSKVPNWISLSYGEIIDFLQLNVSPILQAKLQKASREESRGEAQGEDGFLLSDIVPSHDEDDDYMESDNSQLTFGQSGCR
uniref:Uncharacterized protein n=1 Tax=Gasterosteus aculeatus TaxID=69293 RepID=G3P8Y2_GASAC